jgi:two-component system, OmpR family, sensor histidine kinase KdpD
VLKRLTEFGRYAVGFATIVLITVFFRQESGFAVTTVVLAYLLAVLIASSRWGLGVSVFMSAASMLVLDFYFFPPVGRFTIADPQDWVSLFAFLMTSVIGSDLHARARRQAEEANRRKSEIEQMYEFSRELLKMRDPLDLPNEIPRQIVKSFRTAAAALYLTNKKEVYRSGAEAPQLDAHHLKAAAVSDYQEINRSQGVYFLPVRLGSWVIGSFGIMGPLVSNQALEAIGTLIASAIDRAQAIELLGKAEAVRESERLKSVLLDAVTHDFKTPLTSIKASATSLLEDFNFNREQRRELLVIIDEECDRINRLIGQTGEMARLEAGDVTLEFAPQTVGDLISVALGDCESVQSARPIHIEVKDPNCRVYVDLSWARKVLAHLVRNADLYSSPREPITVGAEENNGFVEFRVTDKGPGIEESEISQVFDRFYRGKGQRHRIPGTGMGLPIAKAIVEAHGGTMEVASRKGHGSVFTFSLPMDRGVGGDN